MSEKVIQQFLMYKETGEIEIDHISEEIYEKLKSKINVPNSDILAPAFNWRVKRHLQMIDLFIDNRDAVKVECKRLLDYVSNEDNRNIEFINSCKEFKLKLFYDKFDNIESLKTELTNIFQ
jgi:hypothetical protein